MNIVSANFIGFLKTNHSFLSHYESFIHNTLQTPPVGFFLSHLTEITLNVDNSSLHFGDDDVPAGCDGDEELALLHAKVFFNQHFHWHLVVDMTLPAQIWARWQFDRYCRLPKRHRLEHVKQGATFSTAERHLPPQRFFSRREWQTFPGPPPSDQEISPFCFFFF